MSKDEIVQSTLPAKEKEPSPSRGCIFACSEYGIFYAVERPDYKCKFCDGPSIYITIDSRANRVKYKINSDGESDRSPEVAKVLKVIADLNLAIGILRARHQDFEFKFLDSVRYQVLNKLKQPTDGQIKVINDILKRNKLGVPEWAVY